MSEPLKSSLQQSHLTGHAIVATFPDGAQALFVQIAIDCPACGRAEWQVAGHHLRALRKLIDEFIDLHPELVGEESGMEVVQRMTFGGAAGSRPEDN